MFLLLPVGTTTVIGTPETSPLVFAFCPCPSPCPSPCPFTAAGKFDNGIDRAWFDPCFKLFVVRLKYNPAGPTGVGEPFELFELGEVYIFESKEARTRGSKGLPEPSLLPGEGNNPWGERECNPPLLENSLPMLLLLVFAPVLLLPVPVLSEWDEEYFSRTFPMAA